MPPLSSQQQYEQDYYAAYRDHGQIPPQTRADQMNNGHISQHQHPMVLIPPHPSQNSSQYYTAPQSFQSHTQSGFPQQHLVQYEHVTQQHNLPTQSQQYQHQYANHVYQQPYGAHGLDGQMPNHSAQHQTISTKGHLSASRTVYSNGQHLTPQQSSDSPVTGLAPYDLGHQPSSPDPLSTTRHQVSSQQAPRQLHAQPQPQVPKPQQSSRTPNQSVISSHPTPKASQQRVVARVEISTQQATARHVQPAEEPPLKRRRSNDGHGLPVCEAPPSQVRSSQPPLASSPLTELRTSQLPPTPSPNVEYRDVLLALADEYITAAYSMSSSLVSADSTDEQHDQYCALMSTAMGCLESALNNYHQPDFCAEARLRLRLATLMFEETDNDEEAIEILSKGVALCERSRLTDLKYSMHHLSSRIMCKKKPKAALKAIDRLVQETEAMSLVHWTYTFRFLRVSLSMELDVASEKAATLKHLDAISVAAREDQAVSAQIIAALLEATVHLKSGGNDAVEAAQRALTAARTQQLGPEMKAMPQTLALLHCLDLACSLAEFALGQIPEKFQQMQSSIEAASRDSGWCKDGSIAVGLTKHCTAELEKDTCGLFRRMQNGHMGIVFSWITKSDLYALGHLLSGIANMYKACGNAPPETYFTEGMKMADHTPNATAQSLQATTLADEQRAAIGVAIRMQRIFVLCGRHDWATARAAVEEMQGTQRVENNGGTARCFKYLTALCEHGLGRLPHALTMYASSELHFTPDTKTKSAESDLRLLATLNSISIRRTLGADESLRADQLMTEVEAHCITHANKAIRATFFILKAMSPENKNAIIKTKQYLQAAVEASKAACNNQLLSICMSIMTTNFFTNIVGDQAEKSARVARSLAKKAGDRLWTAVADGTFADIYERCGKMEEAQAARTEAEMMLNELPGSLVQAMALKTA